MTGFLMSQLDYVHFVHGLVFVLIGAVCFTMWRPGPLETPWWLLGLFALAYGASRWLGILELARGESAWIGAARALAAGASFLLLLEFARQVQRRLLGQAPGPWLHVPFASAVVAATLASGAGDLESASGLFLGAPAAAWVAALFAVAARRTEQLRGGPDARRARWTGAVFFAAFSVASGLVVRGVPFLPDRWPTGEAFAAATGVPVPYVRTLVASGLAAALWGLAVSFDHGGWILRKRRVLFWAVTTGMVFLLVAGWAFTNWLGRLHEQDVVAGARSLAAHVSDSLATEMRAADEGARSLAEIASRLGLLAEGRLDRAGLEKAVDALALGRTDRVVYVLDTRGTTIVSSNRREPASFTGRNFAVRPYFRAAMAGGHGRFFGIGLANARPGYYASEPLRDPAGAVLGVAVYKRDLDAATLGPEGTQRSFVVSGDGQILLSREPGMAGRYLWPAAATAAGAAPDDGTGEAPVLQRAVSAVEQVSAGSERYVAIREALPGSDWSLVVLQGEKITLANRLFGILVTLLLSAQVLTTFVLMQRQLGEESRTMDRRKCAEHRASLLARQADTDALTDLLNRSGFASAVSREISRARRHRQPLTLVMLDLDHFKSVNDLHGHAVGDLVLVATARLLAARLRASDTVARWGGEEFVILAPMTSTEGALRLAEKIRVGLAAAPVGPVGRVTASLGVAELGPEDTAETLLQRADEAMYRAKAGGRDRVEISSPSPAAGAPAAAAWEARWHAATTSYAPMDAEHEALLSVVEDLVRRVDQGGQAEIRTALGRLIAAFTAHFQREEQLMQDFRYPHRERHQEAHDRFVRDAIRVQEEYQQHGGSADFRRWAAGRPGWVQAHVQAHDVELGRFLRRAGAPGGEAPVPGTFGTALAG